VTQHTVDGATSVLSPTGADPATGRLPGRGQAIILLLASCLSVLGAVLLAPVLPTLQAAFAGTPGVEALAPLVLTAPALMIGLLAPVAGRIVDAVGRKRLLVGALLVYSLVGTAPLWLDSLPLVLVSRVGVGITEAAIMTCCTTLIADYFAGRDRDRYFGMQTVYTTLSATAFFAVGGALGGSGWRAPFWLYLVSLPLAVLVALFIWQPARPVSTAERAPLPPAPWRQLAAPVGVTLFGGVAFYALIVELSYVLNDIGITSTATIGAISAVSSLATAAGAFTFGRVAGRGPAVLLPMAFGAIGVGLVVLALGSNVPVVLVGAVVAGYGSGMLLPTLLTWALSPLTFAQRGRGTGLWTSALFLGEFVCPLVVIAIGTALNGLSSALGVVGAGALLMALLVRLAKPHSTKHTAP